MNGAETLGTEDLNYDSLITKFTNADGKLFKGWSTTPDGANMISRVPENDTTLYAVFADIATQNEYGNLIYYNDFSNTAFAAQSYTGWTHDDGQNSHRQLSISLPATTRTTPFSARPTPATW